MPNLRWILGSGVPANYKDFSEDIAFRDHKIAFVLRHARGKDLLDLGCVQHNRDRIVPLPKGVKHTSFHAVVMEAGLIS
jgi:hypothetical protein